MISFLDQKINLRELKNIIQKNLINVIGEKLDII